MPHKSRLTWASLIYFVKSEAEPAEIKAVDFIICSAQAKIAALESRIGDLSLEADDSEAQVALDAALEELGELDLL